MEKAEALLRAPYRTPAETGATKIFPPMAGIDIWPLQRRAHWQKIASQSNARPK